MSIGVIAHVTTPIIEVPIKVEVAVQVGHRLFQVIHNVSDICIHVLIVHIIELIIEKLVVPRALSRMCRFELLQAIIYVRVA